MDIICPKCGEPWDLDTIHDRVAELNDDPPTGETPVTFKSVSADFRRLGCAALGEPCEDQAAGDDEVPTGPGGLSAAEAAATIYELLGDDMDGAASLLEDWEAGF